MIETPSYNSKLPVSDVSRAVVSADNFTVGYNAPNYTTAMEMPSKFRNFPWKYATAPRAFAPPPPEGKVLDRVAGKMDWTMAMLPAF